MICWCCCLVLPAEDVAAAALFCLLKMLLLLFDAHVCLFAIHVRKSYTFDVFMHWVNQ
jgi:hypothetical protein